jgi:hypothetical protein
VQFKNAGHGLMYQYPDRFSKVVLTFLADDAEAKAIKYK